MQNRTIFVFILEIEALCCLLVTLCAAFGLCDFRSNCDVNALISNKKQIQNKLYEIFK